MCDERLQECQREIRRLRYVVRRYAKERQEIKALIQNKIGEPNNSKVQGGSLKKIQNIMEQNDKD